MTTTPGFIQLEGKHTIRSHHAHLADYLHHHFVCRQLRPFLFYQYTQKGAAQSFLFSLVRPGQWQVSSTIRNSIPLKAKYNNCSSLTLVQTLLMGSKHLRITYTWQLWGGSKLFKREFLPADDYNIPYVHGVPEYFRMVVFKAAGFPGGFPRKECNPSGSTMMASPDTSQNSITATDQ